MHREKPWIVAHRGGRKFGPENTVRAIENGIQMDADAIEFDVRVTKDHVPILFHDKTVKRTTNLRKKIDVSTFTLRQIKELDIGSWYSKSFSGEHIITLQEAFELIDNRKPLLVEIKDVDISDITYIIDIIRSNQMENQIYVMSFYPDLLSEVKRLDPIIQTVLLIHKDHTDVSKYISTDTFDHIGFGRRFAIHAKEYINQVKSLNKKVFVYTVNDKRSAKILYRFGVDVLITDNPIKIEEVIEKMNID